MKTTSVKVYLSKEEEIIAKEYADKLGMPLEDLMKDALFKKINNCELLRERD